MRITGWHVDGYGRFHDRGWDDVAAGLTVFHGPNEAGKSTLLSFLRSMLFGLRDGRAAQPAIPALAGGRHGGILRVADEEDAAWTIERYGRDLRVLAADGTPHDELALRRLLGGVNRDVFEAVFAFGLQELEALGGLDEDALRDQLFAASLTGGGSSAHGAIETLRKRTETLYRQRGDSPLKACDERLKALRAERRAALDGRAGYELLRRREAEICDEIGDLEARLHTARLERDRLERLDRVWSLLEPLARRRDELAQLAGGPDVRPTDVTAARDADRAAAAAREQLAELEARRRRTAEQLDALAVDPALLRAVEPLRALDREASAQRDRLLALSGLRATRDRRAEEARAALTDLGPGWDGGRVRAIDVSLPVRREADRLAADAARTRSAADERAAQAAVARRHAEAAAVDIARRAEAVGDAAEPPPAAALRDAATAISEARGALQDLMARRGALQAAVDALEETRASASRTARPGDRPDGVRVSIVVVVAVLGMVLGVVLAVAGQVLGGGALVLVGLAVAWADRAGRPGDPGAEDDGAAAHAEATQRAARVRRQEAQAESERQAIEVLEARLRDAAPAAGLEPEALVSATTTAVVERRATELDELREARRRYDERRAAGVAAQDAAREAEDAAAEARVAAEAARDVARRSVEAWHRWAGEHGLPGTLRSDDAGPLLHALERAQDALRDADDATAATDEAEDALATWSARAAAELQDAGRALPSSVLAGDVEGDARTEAGPGAAATGAHAGAGAGASPGAAATLARRVADHDAVLAAVAEAHADAQAAAGCDAQRAQLLERDAEDAAEADRLRERATHQAALRDGLLARHGAADVAALEDACAATDRRQALRAAVQEGDEAVRAAAGGGAEGDALVAEARTGDVTAWAAHRAELDADLPRWDEQRTAAIAARADAVRDRETLEASVDLPRIDAEIEQVRADAARMLAQLRTTVRARELIEHTLDAFVRDRQPTVLRDASAWFRRITDGRYTDVRQTLQERRGKQTPVLQVVSAHGAGLDPAELSRGTREQLYLALRLALVGRTARDATPLPLVMDDVLVNFSPDRQRSVAEVVAEVARDHQVLFFTCHPATRDLLVEAGGEGVVRVDELTREG